MGTVRFIRFGKSGLDGVFGFSRTERHVGLSVGTERHLGHSFGTERHVGL